MSRADAFEGKMDFTRAVFATSKIPGLAAVCIGCNYRHIRSLKCEVEEDIRRAMVMANLNPKAERMTWAGADLRTANPGCLISGQLVDIEGEVK